MKQIENIFSNSKTKSSISKCPNPKTKIIIDKRENNSLIKSNLINLQANFSEEILQIGDYLINQTIIERKTYKDFLASITDKRLFNQIKEMKKYRTHYLILEGFDFSYNSNLHKNTITGTLLSISQLIPIVYTKNEADTAHLLIQIAKRQEKQKREFASRKFKSKLTLDEQKQFILEGFPKIGPIAAKKLLKEFVSLKNIFNAEEKQLNKILNENQTNLFLSLIKHPQDKPHQFP